MVSAAKSTTLPTNSPTPEIAAQGLEQWRVLIADAFNGKASNAITAALLPAITKFNLDEKEFHEIIDGMAMDSVAIIAPDDRTLDKYCDLVASAVGRVSVRIFGDASPNAMQVAHHLGRALQLTNILRDVAEDAARNRLYLPSDLLDKYGIAARSPSLVLSDPRIAAVCRELSDQAREHYQYADDYMDKCLAAAMRPARIMRSYYGAIFNRLVELDWKDTTYRVSLPKWQKIMLMVKGYFA